MIASKWMWLHSVGLGYTSMIRKVVGNSGYATTLCERWNASTNIFHFPIEDMIITLEDVWRILSLPIEGTLVLVLANEVGHDAATIRVVGQQYY